MTRVALLQFEIALGYVAANLRKVADMAHEAAGQKADLLMLPELWSTGYDLCNARAHANAFESTISSVSELAKQLKVSVAGSLLEPSAEGVRNCFVLINKHGQEVARYRKVHLFAPMGETEYLVAGSELKQAKIGGAQAGLAICYDLRFPEMFRAYAMGGAEVMLVSAEWPAVRVAHWTALLEARAIENQAYVAACNACGKTGDTEFGGRSCVWSPTGELLVDAGEDEGVFCADIDASVASDLRNAVPLFGNRRPELYA
jgi:omega-amidase